MVGSSGKPRVVLVGRRKAAAATARRLGLRPVTIVPGDDVVERAREALAERPPSAVVAVSERSVADAAAIRAALGLPGMSVNAAHRCTDKLAMKRAAAAAGVPITRWLEVEPGACAADLIDQLGLPLVLKHRVGSGGRELYVAQTAGEVAAAMRPGLLAEAFVNGVEMSVESLLAGGEVVFRNPTRYLEPRWANVVPAALPAAERARVYALVDQVHRAFGIDRGMTHAELFLTEHGPVFGEIAARPPGGYLMELIRLAYGFDPWEAVMRIELGEAPALPQQANCFAAVRVVHPGAGIVMAVSGADRASALPGVERVRLALASGDSVGPRLGAGQNVGEVVVTAGDHDTCVARLAAAAAELHIELSPH